MTKAEKILSLQVRIKKLEGKEINLKCPGVLKNLRTELLKTELNIK